MKAWPSNATCMKEAASQKPERERALQDPSAKGLYALTAAAHPCPSPQ